MITDRLVHYINADPASREDLSLVISECEWSNIKASMAVAALQKVTFYFNVLSNRDQIQSISLSNPIPGPIREVFSDVASYWSSVFPCCFGRLTLETMGISIPSWTGRDA
jgi:hypothetical protein